MGQTQEPRATEQAGVDLGEPHHPAPRPDLFDPAPFDPESTELDPADFEPRPFAFPQRKRIVTAAFLLLALLLAIVLPPLLNVNRFRRQIATSISRSLGRPVHMDTVSLSLLPMPGFTLENFVVGEDPAFGSEPVIRANSVRARLRMRSLWRRRVEFSRISLTDTSVNLVHRGDGRWNIESILLQASRIQAAPTAQVAGGDAPRFPYIEASNARVNVKMGLEKMPIALTETEFALWLPQPQQWRLRLLGHPARTDNAATDTGQMRLQGTLGKAGSMADVPVDLQAEWTGAPLGAVSWILLGRDADFRGDMTLRAAVAGTVGANSLSTRLELRGARRAEFVPARSLDLDVACKARATGIFHRLEDLQCVLPADAVTSGVDITGSIPELLHPGVAALTAQVRNVDASRLLDALRLATPSVSPGLELAGNLSGSMSLDPAQGLFTIDRTRLALPSPTGPVNVVVNQLINLQVESGRLSLPPVPLDLGGTATLEAHLTRTGYSMHLAGTVLRSRLLALARALPQFGQGLAEALPPAPELPQAAPILNPSPTPPAPTASAAPAPPESLLHIDLTSSRTWAGAQTWTAAIPRSTPPRRPGRR